MGKKRSQPTDAAMKEKALARWENEGGAILSPKRRVDKKVLAEDSSPKKKNGLRFGTKQRP